MRLSKLLLLIVIQINFISICRAQTLDFVSNQAHTGSVVDLDYSKDGNFILSNGINEWILWEGHSGRVIFRCSAVGKFSHVGFSSEKNFIVAADAYPNRQTHIKRWDFRTRRVLDDFAQDSLQAQLKYQEVISIFFDEKSQRFIWGDNETLSIYNAHLNLFKLYKSINGRHNYIIKMILSGDKLFLMTLGTDQKKAPNIIYYSALSDDMTFREFNSISPVDDLFYCSKYDYLCYTTKDGRLIRTRPGVQGNSAISLPDFSPSFTRLYQLSDPNSLYVSYLAMSVKVNLVTDELQILIPKRVSYADFSMVCPDHEQFCTIWSGTYISRYQKFDNEWVRIFDYGNHSLEGNGYFAYLGDNRLYIEANYVAGTKGFFVDLNNFSFFKCDDYCNTSEIGRVKTFPGESSVMALVAKPEGTYPKYRNHFYLKEFGFDGKVKDSLDIDKVIKTGNSLWPISFDLSADKRTFIIGDTVNATLTYISEDSKTVTGSTNIPSSVRGIYPAIFHPILFGPASSQVISAGDRITWYDLNKHVVLAKIDSLEYGGYDQLGFDHDSTSVVFKSSRFYRYSLITGRRDTIWLINDASVLLPIRLNNKKEWLVGTTNGSLELLDSSFNKVIRQINIHSGSIKHLVFDQKSQRIFTSGVDRRIVITNISSFEPVATIVLQSEKGKRALFIYDKAGNYYYPAFYTNLMHLELDNKSYDFGSYDQLKNRPDKIAELISTDTSYVSQLREAYLVRRKRLNIADSSISLAELPKLAILGQDTILHLKAVNSQTFQIELSHRNEKGNKLHILANGVPVYGLKGMLVAAGSGPVAVNVRLIKGINYLQFYAEDNRGNLSLKTDVTIEFRPLKHVRHKIYFIGAGISSYANKGMHLPFSGKDIKDVESDLKNRLGGNLISHLFIDSSFVKDSISKIRDIIGQSTEEDIIVFYYSGHGTRSKTHDFLFCPVNTNFSNPDQDGIGLNQILQCFDACKARKRIMLIDACESGDYVATQKDQNINSLTQKNKAKAANPSNTGFLDFYNRYFSDLSNEFGVQILSSAYGTEEAFQPYKFRHSVFTYCFLQAMTEYSTIKQQKILASFRVSDLRDYLSKSVFETSEHRQVPATVSFNTQNDWEITPLVEN